MYSEQINEFFNDELKTDQLIISLYMYTAFSLLYDYAMFQTVSVSMSELECDRHSVLSSDL